MRRLVDLFGTWPVLLDGGWATELQKVGLPPNTPSDAWNLSHPEAVGAVARSYVEVGSQLILTNTFRSNPITLSELGLGDQVARINHEGVRISRDEASQVSGVRVFGSIGPVLYKGPIARDRRSILRASFATQARSLADGGVEGIVLETFGDPEEAELALDAAAATELPVIASFAFPSGSADRPEPSNAVDPKRGTGPISIEGVARRMESLGAAGVGANCIDAREASRIAERLVSGTRLPVWIKPNGGASQAVWDRPEGFSRFVAETILRGASLVGGCCGSTPDHIRVVDRVVGRSRSRRHEERR